MKKIISVLLLSAISFLSHADVIFKYGAVASDNDEPNLLTWAGVWGETNNCDYCVALFALETYGESKQPRDRLVGVDYVIKSLETNDGLFRTNLGFAVADESLQGGEVFNFHFGLSLTAKNCIYGFSCSLNYDHFSNGKTLFDREHIVFNEPLDLVSVGIGF